MIDPIVHATAFLDRYGTSPKNINELRSRKLLIELLAIEFRAVAEYARKETLEQVEAELSQLISPQYSNILKR